MRRIGSDNLSVGQSDDALPDTPTGRNHLLKRLRTRFIQYARSKEAKLGAERHDPAVFEKINEMLARWGEVLERHRPVIELAEHPAFIEWRSEILAGLDRDRDSMADQVIARYQTNSPDALVNAVAQKLVRGLFRTFDEALAEAERARRHEEAALDRLHQVEREGI